MIFFSSKKGQHPWKTDHARYRRLKSAHERLQAERSQLAKSQPCGCPGEALWAFVAIIEREWSFLGYDVATGNQAWQDVSIVRNADLSEAIQLLCYFSRAEHWVDNGYEQLIVLGFLTAVMNRLDELFRTCSGSNPTVKPTD